MGNLHEIIDKLCSEHGVTGYKMCQDLGLSKSFMTELRKGRTKSIRAETASKIAKYFGVSVEDLLDDSRDEKKPDVKVDAEPIEDLPISRVARNGRKMTLDEQKKLYDVAKAMFPGYFEDDET